MRGKKEACVLWLSVTFVRKCPCTISSYPRDKSSPSVIYLINSAIMHTHDVGPKHKLQSKLKEWALKMCTGLFFFSCQIRIS